MHEDHKERAQAASKHASACVAIEERLTRRQALQQQMNDLDNELASLEKSRDEAFSQLSGGGATLASASATGGTSGSVA